MSLLIALIIALLVGFLAYLLAGLFDYTKRYAQPIGLVIAILVFLARLGYGL